VTIAVEQFLKKVTTVVSSSFFELSQFEQFTPTHLNQRDPK
jgi:hypothetical protein